MSDSAGTTYGGGMTRGQVVLVWAIATLLFLFVEGPVWNDPWNFATLDAAIWLSYAPIPLMVLACLAWRRRLRPRAFFLDTSLVVMLKYSTTFMIAMVLWEVRPAPPIKSAYASATSHARAGAAPGTSDAPTDLGGGVAVLEGRVVDPSGAPSGAPASGAVVWISGGLDGLVLGPAERVVRVGRAGGIEPSITVVGAGQLLEATSGDGRLHTLVAAIDGAQLFNVPLLPSGDASSVRAPDVSGIATLRCTVHPHEPHASLVVAPSRLHARAEAGGRFTIAGVPARPVEVSALGAHGRASLRAHPQPGERVLLEIQLAP